MSIRVVVVDDQTLVRKGFAAMLALQPDIDVVGDAEDGAAALELCRSLAPDVVLLDLRMPVMDGIETTRLVVQRHGATGPRILILSTFDDEDLVHSALLAGASGFLLKDAHPEELARAVRAVADGDSVLAPAITRTIVQEYAAGRAERHVPSPGAEVPPGFGDLTEREREVLTLMALGRSNREIAEEMVLALTTVKSHVGRIFAKLSVRDRVQAVIAAYRAGLVRPDTDGHGSQG